jgi:LmbE family N-acetylglucosaminyl deacetylase
LRDGDEVHWLVMTTPAEPPASAAGRHKAGELAQVAEAYGFARVHELGFTESRLDAIPLADIVERCGGIVRSSEAEVIYLPHPGDAHTDHRVAFEGGVACTKSFRYPTVRRVLVYETLSETDFGVNPDANGFRPNVFIDIGPFLDEKLKIMRTYTDELRPHPFPRSEASIRALATLRGAACGCVAAEAFMLLREFR